MKQAITTLFTFLISLSLVLSPLVAYADDTPPTECTEPVAVLKPCSGVLLPSDAAGEGLRCLSITVPRLKAEIDYLNTTYTSREKRYELLLNAERTRGDRLFTQLQEASGMTAPKWYEHPIFWFSVGFVVAGATTVGITYAVNND